MEKRDKSAPYSFSIEHVWALAVMVGIFAFLNTHPIRPHDFWWHAAVGREIAATGTIPLVDTFSYTMAGTPYSSYNAFWLMEVTLYAVYSLGGAALTVFAHSLTISAAYALLLWLSRRISGSWRAAAFSTLFAAALGFNDWNVRPQAVAFPIAAVFLLAIHQYREKRRPGWLLVFPLGMAIWVNSHGTFPIGLVLIGLWLADEAWSWVQTRLSTRDETSARQLLVPASVLLVTVLACLANPRGWGIINYVSSLSTNPVVQRMVPEWASSTFDTLGGAIFLVGFLLSTVLLILSPRRPSLFQLAAFLAFGGLGLKTLRGALWFGIVMAPVLADHLTALGAEIEKMGLRSEKASPASDKPVLNYLLAGLLVVGAFATLPWFKSWLPLSPEKTGVISAETPVAATEFLLQENLPGHLFHNMAYGSYLIWSAQPEYPVFVDSRIELYPPEIWFDYLEISSGSGEWEDLLDFYEVQTLMVDRESQRGLKEAATASEGWTRIYADAYTSLFTRE